MNRVKQVYMNLTDRMDREDYDLVESILNEKEIFLFKKLLKSEQKHSVRLARNVELAIMDKSINNIILNENKELLIKAALLHDVGKSITRLNVLDKCILVLLNDITKGNLRNVKHKKIDCYYNHSIYSFNMLKEITDNDKLLHIIKNHHSKTDDELIKLFQSIDNIS